MTTILGDWGFSSDERPSGDRFGRLLSHTPSYTVYIDRPQKVAEVWPVVDELTAQHGIVTSLIVPGYRERAGDTVHGELRTERLLAPNRSDLHPWSPGHGPMTRSGWCGLPRTSRRSRVSAVCPRRSSGSRWPTVTASSSPH